MDMKDGGVLLSHHFSNYEFLAEYIARNVPDMYGAHEPLRGRCSNRLLLWLRSREKVYVKKFQTRPWDIFHLINQGGVFGYMFDQDDKNNSMIGSFFNRKCSYAKAPFVVIKRTGAPVFLSSISRNGLKSYTIDVVRFDRFDLSLVQGYFERVIEECPAQWYGWSHRRFKSVSPEIYESK
ncbi:MAG: lysophospholipid acyltransferase family protein [Fibrobacterales bacterium]